MLKLLIITLLVLEGCLICFASIGYMFWLLWKATRTRAALFTVFLVIPQGEYYIMELWAGLKRQTPARH